MRQTEKKNMNANKRTIKELFEPPAALLEELLKEFLASGFWLNMLEMPNGT